MSLNVQCGHLIIPDFLLNVLPGTSMTTKTDTYEHICVFIMSIQPCLDMQIHINRNIYIETQNIIVREGFPAPLFKTPTP